MPKRTDFPSDLLTIGMFAPLVMAARTQMLFLELARPSRKGRLEAHRMTAEKPLALFEAAVAVQRSMFESSANLWRDMVLAANAFALAAPAAPLMALAPVRRRVRANALRLTGF